MPGLLDVVIQNLLGSPQTGQGLIEPKNLVDAAQRGPSAPAVPRQAPVVPGQLPASVPNTSTTSGPPPGQTASPAAKPENSGGNNLLAMLAKFGIPVGSAIAGTVNPNLLPQAAGLASGFNEGVQREEDLNRKQNIKIFDQDTGEIIDTGQVISATDKILTKSKSKEDFRDLLLKEMLGIDSPEGQTGDAVKQAEQKVKEFNSVEEAESANLPAGTKVLIDGRSATIQ